MTNNVCIYHLATIIARNGLIPYNATAATRPAKTATCRHYLSCLGRRNTIVCHASDAVRDENGDDVDNDDDDDDDDDAGVHRSSEHKKPAGR